MEPEILAVVIATLVSPVFLKLVEWAFNSASATNRRTQERLDALGKRVDELKNANQELSMKVVLQEQKIKDQQETIAGLQKENTEKDKIIRELQSQIETLRTKRGSKR